MKDECVTVEQIAKVLELPAGDPVRRHVDQCPRCSSLLAAYQAFIVADPTVGASTADAELRLMDFLNERIGSPEPAPPPADDAPGDEGLLARWRGIFVLRPAWIAAALVVVVAAVLWWQPWVVEQPALRSTAESSLLELLPPEPLPGGAVRIDWEAREGADKYEIILYDSNLAEIIRIEAGPATFFDLTREDLPPGSPSVLICRVAAFQDGDEVAETAPIPLEFP